MPENTLYALNQVRQSYNTPEELEVSQTKNVLHTKTFRKELNATKCRIQHQRQKWHRGHNDLSSIDHTLAGITGDLVISPEQCLTLAKGKMIYLADQFLELSTIQRTLLSSQKVLRAIKKRNQCTATSWITRGTVLPHMQRTTLKVKMSIGKVLSDSAQVLPCAWEELSCDTTSLDLFAYIWDYPGNCVLSVH